MPARFPPICILAPDQRHGNLMHEIAFRRYPLIFVLSNTVSDSTRAEEPNQVRQDRLRGAAPALQRGGYWPSIDLTRYSISVLAQSGDKPGRFSPSTISTPSKMPRS